MDPRRGELKLSIRALNDETERSAYQQYRTEPLPAEHRFWHHPKVTVTPHLSGPTPREPAAQQIAQAIAQLERGAAPSSLPGYVDRTRGY